MQSENSHRRLCEIVAKWSLKQKIYDICSWELQWNNGFVDVIALTSPLKSNGRITSIEIKRTHSDLIADVTKGKLLKYELGSTHCYLAGTKEAFNITNTTSKKEVINKLTEMGVPKYWGLLLLPTKGNAKPKMFRPARQFGKLLPNIQLDLTIQIAKSFAHRILNKHSPIQD
jgi:hypothetical protein